MTQKYINNPSDNPDYDGKSGLNSAQQAIDELQKVGRVLESGAKASSGGAIEGLAASVNKAAEQALVAQASLGQNLSNNGPSLGLGGASGNEEPED